MRRPVAGLYAVILAIVPVPFAALATPPEAETEHIVQDRETLNGIANRAEVTPTAIIGANGLKPPYVVRSGQKLTIPRAKKPAPPKAEAKPASTVKAPAATNKPTPEKPAAAPGTDPAKESVHVVTEGETLGGIAVRAKVPRVLIAEANGLKPPYAVHTGQKLNIPRTRHYTVKAGDTGFGVAYKFAVPWTQIAVANGLDPQEALKAGQELLIPTLIEQPSPKLPADAAEVASTAAAATASAAKAPAKRSRVRFAWPLEGTVRRGWRPRDAADHHDGLDIGAPAGTAVRASAAGTVVFAGNENEQFGNLVVVDHGDGWNTAYGFLSRVTVRKGDKVAAGERVGLVGHTGQTKRDELHFEVRQDGVPVDPQPQLPDAP